MRTLLHTILGVFFIFSLGRVEEAAAQGLASLPPPINVDVTQLQYSSPYGPRALSGKGYQFHKGVDYLYGLGTPIHAVQGGTIDKLDYEGQAGWLMSITGGANDPFPGQRFSYLHLFTDDWLNTAGPLPTDDEGNPIFGEANVDLGGGITSFVTLEGLNTGPGPFNCFAIIFWKIFAKNQPTPGFSDIPIVGFSPCKDPHGNGLPIGSPMFGFRTQNTVPQGTLIAPVGRSGAASGCFNPQNPSTYACAHLHLQVNSGDQNELLYVQHDHSGAPAYNISIFKYKGDPTSTVALDANRVQLNGGETLDPTQDTPLILRTEVNYATVGHDLDEVQIFMYKEGTPQPDLIDFNYGGTGREKRSVSELHCSTASPCDVIQEGVYPQLHNGGVVDFLSDPIDLATLDPGNYVVLVRAINILGIVEEKSITVTIPSPSFSVSAVCVQQLNPASTAPGCGGTPNAPFCTGTAYLDSVLVLESLSGSVGPGVAIVPPTLTFPVLPAGCGRGSNQFPCPGPAGMLWDSVTVNPGNPANTFLAAAEATQGGIICISQDGGFFCRGYETLLQYLGSPPILNSAFWTPLVAGAPAGSYVTAFRVPSGLAWVAGEAVSNQTNQSASPGSTGSPPDPPIPVGSVSISVPVPVAQGAKPLPPRVVSVSCP